VWREVRENFSFYWDAAEGMHRLDSLVDPADPPRTSVRIGGLSPRINQLGQATTTALVSGVRRAVVLTPLPAR